MHKWQLCLNFFQNWIRKYTNNKLMGTPSVPPLPCMVVWYAHTVLPRGTYAPFKYRSNLAEEATFITASNWDFLQFSICYCYITHYKYFWFPQVSRFTWIGFYITDNIEMMYLHGHTHPYVSFVIDLIDIIYDTKGFISWGRTHIIYLMHETISI